MTTLGLLVCLESVQEETERTRRDIEEFQHPLTLLFIFLLPLVAVHLPSSLPLSVPRILALLLCS